ncbi:MAG TPA: hypothetical protein VF216_11540, partial [Mizugakiibacter sp.]
DGERVDDAIAYYEVAANLFKRGALVRRPTDGAPVAPTLAGTASEAAPPAAAAHASASGP